MFVLHVEPLNVVPRLELDEDSKISHWQLQTNFSSKVEH